MTLTTHAVVGAAVAALVPTHPIVGFIGGFVSHFALDSIPHWSEGRALMRSERKWDESHEIKMLLPGQDLLHDVLVVLTDSAIGFSLSILILFYFFHVPLLIVLLGAFAGQMPDGLQFIYFQFQPKFMTPLQKFHGRIQTEYDSYAYLGIEAGIILTVVAMGILGVFMLQ